MLKTRLLVSASLLTLCLWASSRASAQRNAQSIASANTSAQSGPEPLPPPDAEALLLPQPLPPAAPPQTTPASQPLRPHNHHRRNLLILVAIGVALPIILVVVADR